MTQVNRVTFGERLAFARFLYHLEHGEPPSNAAIGEAAGRSGPAVTAWMVREDAPPFYDVREPLARFLGVDEKWLFEGTGEPPRPDLWRDWLAKQRHRRSSSSGAGKKRKSS